MTGCGRSRGIGSYLTNESSQQLLERQNPPIIDTYKSSIFTANNQSKKRVENSVAGPPAVAENLPLEDILSY